MPQAKTVKEQALSIISVLPDDADWDELMYRCYVQQKLLKALDAETRETIAHSELKARMLGNDHPLD